MMILLLYKYTLSISAKQILNILLFKCIELRRGGIGMLKGEGKKERR